MAEKRAQHWVDSILAPKPVDPASQTFTLILQILVGIVLIAAWVMIIYHGLRFFRNRKKRKGQPSSTVIYGAWQGHNLGTTTMEPGDLTRIEGELREAPKDEE